MNNLMGEDGTVHKLMTPTSKKLAKALAKSISFKNNFQKSEKKKRIIDQCWHMET